ncbi:MAG: DUF429 domain-containing protein [Candidatus Bathyarchaeia archaeon]
MLVVGLDLAGVENKPSGFCVLEGMRAETYLLYTDEEIIQKVRELKPNVIAVDAPLSLPPGRTSIEERTGTHLRECDRELLRRGIKFFPITLGPMRKLTQRGMRLRETLEVEGFRVIEVYPGGAQDVLGIPRKGMGLKKLREGLEKLGIQGLKESVSDHELDAVTSAFVGRLFLEGKTETLGELREGIVMPRK